MKLLLVTSRAAADMLEEVVRDLRSRLGGRVEFEVFVSSVPVASLASAEFIGKELMEFLKEMKDFDLIVIPGLVHGSARTVEELTGIKTVKGPRYVGDLPDFVDMLLAGFEFSPDVPADELLRETIVSGLDEKVSKLSAESKAAFYLRGIKVPVKPPPLLLLYETPADPEKAVADAVYVKELGYEGVVIGCESWGCPKSVVRETIRCVRKVWPNALLGLDARDYFSLSDIIALSDVDIVMNITHREVKEISEVLRDKATVIIPEAGAADPIDSIREGIRAAESAGAKPIIDPMLLPPLNGLVPSLSTFFSSLRIFKEYPHLMGAPNIYELIDADSPGIAAILTSIAVEAGASLILITESSNKARGAAQEFSIARRMVLRAFARRSPPKDVGASLLILKEKRDRSVRPPKLSAREVVVDRYVPPRLDRGYFVKIYVDNERERIVADVYSAKGDAVLRVTGRDALSVARALLSEVPGISKEHAAYLGYELGKAEIALRLMRSYVQDLPLFDFSYRRRSAKP